MGKVIKAIFDQLGGNEITTESRYQYDYGMVLKFGGAVTLPQAYEVHFALDKTGDAVTQIGGADGVTVPDSMFTSGSPIYAWVYLHDGETDGYTQYTAIIPVIKRAAPSDLEPTPVQQSAIDQAIAALGVAVEQTAADVETTTANAENASASAEAAAASAAEAAQTAVGVEANVAAAQAAESAAEAARDRAVQAETSADQSKTAAATSAANAAQSATAAGLSETAAKTAETGAEASATAAAQSATSAANSATSASGSASTASSAATTATQKAQAAATSESNAVSAKNAAVSAKTAAEAAATTATTKAGEASTSATNAAASAESVASSAAQIATNTAEITALKEDLGTLSPLLWSMEISDDVKHPFVINPSDSFTVETVDGSTFASGSYFRTYDANGNQTAYYSLPTSSVRRVEIYASDKAKCESVRIENPQGKSYKITNNSSDSNLTPFKVTAQDSKHISNNVFYRTNRISIPSAQVATSYRLDGNGLAVNQSGYSLYKWPVTAGEYIWIYVDKVSGGTYQFQNASSVSGTFPNNSLVGVPVTTAEDGLVKVPDGASWVILSNVKDDTQRGVYNFRSIAHDSPTRKNIIGMEGGVLYPVRLKQGDKLTYSPADGQAIGSELHFYTYDSAGTQTHYWNMGNHASRTIEMLDDVYYVGWQKNPSKAVQVEIGESASAYEPYVLRTEDSNVVSNVMSSVKSKTLLEQSFNSAYHVGATDFATKCTEFSALMYGDAKDGVDVSAPTDCEAFLFFTDPHLVQSSGWEDRCYELISQIQKYYNSTPTTFCLCGGDWIGNGDLPDVACYKMGYIDGFMHSMFDDCYMLVGNHDTNYQGKLTEESETYTTRLSNQSIADLWYRKEGRAYFSFSGANTKFYCFDTGTESQALTVYDNYGWEQATWFATALASDNSEHIAIASHILYNNLPTDSEVCPIMAKVLEIAEAYNDRTTISVNGTTYDYTSATGKIEFCVCGHSHGDYNGILNGIPYFLTINAGKLSDTASFDMVLIDYDNNVINLVRVGSGYNRTISLVTGQLVTE